MSYMRKKGLSVTDQAEEVMGRLMGRAREVVKVGIRSNPSTDLSRGPSPVFDILKQHFSDAAFSSMPLADFYGTLPLSDEQPFDYWLRLNRAMDMAEDCLKRQNKRVDDPSRELTVMFIRHCPDPELSLIFKCKPLQQWTAADVHERLDEYRRERRYSNLTTVTPPITMLKQGVSAAMHTTLPAVRPATESNPVCRPAQSSQGSAEPMDRILAMLERVLEQRPQQASGSADRQFNKGQRNRMKSPVPCEVCGDAGHTTHFHCRANHLCFLCHVAGHARAECPKATALKPVGVVSTGTTTQNQEN